MDLIPDLDSLTLWIKDYGSIALFVLLALGIIALPVPEETLMVISGILVSQGILSPHGTFLAAFLGSMCGITVSYLLGRTAGLYFLHRYGKWVGIKTEHLDKVHIWFERFGKWALLIGYFIPGVRHFTGFIAGTSNLEFPHFALFAYIGAFIWSSLFLSIGYFFGNYWLKYFENLEISLDWIFFLIGAAILGYVIYRLKKQPTPYK